MRQRRLLRFHGLKRPRIRQTWNKYNLYNMSRERIPFLIQKTFFQQKWAAKALTRGYHGEHVQEGKWERMFSRRLLSVVNMDPKYMAACDGSEQAAGRGSGLEPSPHDAADNTGRNGRGRAHARNGSSTAMTPYMQMTYAPMERRLDVAVFRALFACSARQARQFVTHGAVKVNGIRMRYPGYLLNPGDMFQVDPEKVMLATGATKDRRAANQDKAAVKREARTVEAPGNVADKESSSEPTDEVAKPDEINLQKEGKREFTDQEKTSYREKQKAKALLKKAKALASSDDVGAKKKQAIRHLMKGVKEVMQGMAGRDDAVPRSAHVVDDLSELVSRLVISPSKAKKQVWEDKKEADLKSSMGKWGTVENLNKEELEQLKAIIAAENENPYDPSKPYLTPWTPRPFMAPFAFIPRYLEVNQNICAAVYLRHPVARQGMAEVPTPYPPEINQLAFNWYLRRG